MKRTDLIAKLEEMMPLYKAEDKRLLDIYNAEMKEYGAGVQARVKELARMKKTELMEFLLRKDIETFVKGPYVYKNHNRLYDSYYTDTYRQPFLPTKFSYVTKAEDYLKHLRLSSTRQFTLSQDGKNHELYKLVTFEPHTESP